MIIDEKVLMYSPPPPYVVAPAAPLVAGARPVRLTFIALPANILLEIVYTLFPQKDGPDQVSVERQRRTLYWLTTSLRLVNRSFYIACMHVLRSTYLPSYQSLIRPPYTSDPFPVASSTAPEYTSIIQDTSSSPLQTIQRETAVLDRFIALKVREDVFVDESELHLEREDMFKDLFDLSQPRARLEDLVRIYGMRDGLIVTTTKPATSNSSTKDTPISSQNASTVTLPPPPSPRSPVSRTASFFSSFKSKSASPAPAAPSSSYSQTSSSRTAQQKAEPLLFQTISVSFNPRTVALQLNVPGRRKTVAQVQRSRDEMLEVAAKRLVRELKSVLEE